MGLMAYRTRSKRPLRDVPLGQLEAELRAPDITPDMYDTSSAHEDREWTDWLRGLMNSDMDNEGRCVHTRMCLSVCASATQSLSLSLQRTVMMKMTQNITSWLILMNRTWRITATTRLSASPVSFARTHVEVTLIKVLLSYYEHVMSHILFLSHREGSQ